ncbi:hypothetical protein DL768_009392 [Monosporascus sp. mg162]|nr:hypothetical protein DL768_009392 [Monosporascus sp. mg162]
MNGIKRDVRAREERYRQVEDDVKELKLKSERHNDTMEQMNNMMIQLLDTFQPKTRSSKSLRSETKPRRLFTKKPDPPKREKSEEKKEKLPKLLKGKEVVRNNPDDSDSSSSSFSDSFGGPPKKKKDRYSFPSSSFSGSSSSSGFSSSDSSSELDARLKDKKDSKKSSDGSDSKLRWKRFDFLDKENYLSGWANWELWSNALNLALEEISYEDGMKLKQLD